MFELLSAYPRAVGRAARQSMRRLGLQALGGVLLAVGFVMLTAAAWTVLAQTWSPLAAWVVLAAVFLGLAAIVFGVASSMEKPRMPTPSSVSRHETPHHTVELPPQAARSALLAAFLFGFTTYMKARNRRSD